MATAWAKIQPVEGPVSLLEITSEQLANSLHEKEIVKSRDDIVAEIDSQDHVICQPTDMDSDEVIAHMLQSQYNREYDQMLKLTEEKLNRDAKVSISYAKHRTCTFDDQEDKPTDSEDGARDIDRFVSIEKEYASIRRCGYKKIGEGSRIVTKHDMLMTSRINACRVLQFPPGIRTGDTGGFDVKLNNNVFNTLRAHSNAQCSRRKPKARPRTK